MKNEEKENEDLTTELVYDKNDTKEERERKYQHNLLVIKHKYRKGGPEDNGLGLWAIPVFCIVFWLIYKFIGG